MADRSKIEWTDATWNIVTGCDIVSPGCTNCYAMRLAGTRMRNHPSRAGLTREVNGHHVWTGKVHFNAGWLDLPLRWKRPRMIFVAAHGDLFHPGVTDAQLDQIFAVMALCPQHTFQVLTKRPERARAYLGDPSTMDRMYDIVCERAVNEVLGVLLTYRDRQPPDDMVGRRVPLAIWPLANVWLGTSVEDQKRADERITELLATPAAVRWISAEPLLGPVDLTNLTRRMGVGEHVFSALDCDVDPADDEWGGSVIDWVVAGGESGQGARPMHPDWVRSLRDQCAAAGVAFHFKQWGEWLGGRYYLDLDDWLQFETLEEKLLRLKREDDQHFWDEDAVPEGLGSLRVGRKRAGRLLDGVEHNGVPAR